MNDDTALAAKLTVLIVASPIPTHPSTGLMWEAIQSLERSGLDGDVPIVLSHDAVRPRADASVVSRYSAYLQRVRSETAQFERIRIVESEEWGHLSGTIRNGLSFVQTPLVLVCQHDFVFERTVDWQRVVEVVGQNPEIRHVRFNKRRTEPSFWDGRTRKREQFFRNVSAQTSSGSVNLVRTVAWTDMNHIAPTDYYKQVVGGLLGARREYPEKPLDIVASPSTHKILGTYIYGSVGDPAVTRHVDGARLGVTPKQSHGRQKSIRSIAHSLRVRAFMIHDHVWLRIKLSWWSRFPSRISKRRTAWT